MDSALARRMLAATTEITRVALSADQPDAVLPLVVQRAAELAEADLGLLSVLGPDDRVTVEAHYSAPSAPVPLADPVGTVLSSRSAAARVARSGVPVVVDDLLDDPQTAPYVPAALRVYGPFAVAAFGTRERRLGSLAVYRRREASTFDRTAVDVLTGFAAQAGLVLVLAEGVTARQRIAVYQERERISRDLHDVIVQRLYATGVQLEVLQRKLGNRLDEADSERFAEIVGQVDRTIEDIRATARALRSADPESTDNGRSLEDSIRSEVQIAGELLGFPPELEIEGELGEVPVRVADNARAALREALSNVVRHSGASTVAVSVERSGARLSLRVADNGCGIPQGVSKRGLRNMAERATSMGGNCEISSSPERGTTVTWQVPLEG